MRQVFGWIVCMLVAVGIGRGAEPGLRWDDPRLKDWSSLWQAGDYDAVIAALEADILSDSPHPLAVMGWVRVHARRGHLAAALAAASPALRAQVAAAAEAERLYTDCRFAEILTLYPRDRIAAIEDFSILRVVCYSAYYEEQVDLQAAVIARMAEVAPGSFYAVRACMDLADGHDLAAVTAMQQALAASPAKDGEVATMIATLIAAQNDLTGHPMIAHTNRLTWAKSWLASHPHDGTAMLYIGLFATHLHRLEEALAAHTQAMETYPFFWYDDGMAEVLLRLYRDEEARAALARWTGKTGRDLDLALAESLTAVGRPGPARAILLRLIADQPDWPQPRVRLAEIEAGVQRFAAAAELMEEAVRLEPDSLPYIRTLVKYLNETGESDRAVELAVARHADGSINGHGYESTNFYYEWMNALGTSDRLDERLAVAREAAEAYPNSRWMVSHLGYTLKLREDTEAALAVLTPVVRRWPNYAWAVGMYAELIDAQQGKDAGTAALDALCKQYPTVPALWQALAGRGTIFHTLDVYARAAVANPGRYWPRYYQIAARERYPDLRATTLPHLDLETPATPGDLAQLIETALWMPGQDAYRDHLQLPDHFDFLALADRYLALNGDAAWYHYRRYEYLASTGRAQEAAAALEAAIIAHHERGHFIYTAKQNTTETLGIGRQNHYLLRYLEANPYDGERTGSVIHYLSKWGGSPVVAMKWCEFLRDAQPNAFASGRAKSEYYTLLARFGDHRKAYEMEYARESHLSPSQRYIDWYESRRQKAQQQEWVDIQFDYDTDSVSVTKADGSTRTQTFHPVTGKITRLQVGDAWVAADYDAAGDDLVRLYTSSGSELALTYNDAGQIVEMKTSEGKHLLFTFNEAGKPTVIDVVGVGTLLTTYDADGEVDAVTTEGGAEKYEITQAITSAFSHLTNSLRLLQTGQIEELLPDDPQESALLDAVDTALEAGNVSAAVVAKLDLGEHYAANTARNPGYREAASEVFSDAWNMVAESADLATAPVLTRLLDNWWNAERERFLVGMDRETMTAWEERLRRFRRFQILTDDAGLQAAIERVEQSPIAIMDRARWLPQSDLGNEGFWRRWDIADILPRTLPSDTRLTAVLARRNGDVVVGTSRGICVLRRGYWEWYGFDEQVGIFSHDLPPTALKSSSEILSLAESDDATTLWIGTANGLIVLHQPLPDGADDADPEAALTDRPAFPYSASGKRLATVKQGLPSPRAEQLAVLDEGVVVRTPRGLALIEAEVSRTFLTDGETLRFISPFAWEWSSFVLDVDALVDNTDVDREKHEATLQAIAEAVAAGTPFATRMRSLFDDGLEEMTDEAVEATLKWNFCEVTWHRDQRVLVGAGDTLYCLANGELTPILDRAVESAVCDSYSEQVHVLIQGRVFVADWDGEGALGTLVPVADQGNIQSTGTIHGLSLLPVDTGEVDEDGGLQDRLVVMTDQGMAVFAANHFEHVTVTGNGRNSGVRQASHQTRSLVLLGDAGVHIFSGDKVLRSEMGVYDLRSSTAWGLTFVATGNWLYAVPHATGRLEEFSIASSSHLALDAQERLVTNDGTDIVRFEVGSTSYDHLFSAASSYGQVSGDLTSLIVARDGTIWATAGASLFRWREGDEAATEFCYFTDPEAFPSRTHYMTRVVETVNGDILAIGSQEGHLQHQGQRLVGGVLKWNGTSFDRQSDMLESRFWLSYTPINGTDAIAGTTGGFQVIRDGRLMAAAELDPTYRELQAGNPRLFMGSRGVSIGAGVWLFGTARGVIAYRDGTWLDATRLNWLLPRQELAAYGSRHVYAVETDPRGRIYAATRNGLLIYDGQEDGTSFLFTQGRSELAISEAERQKLMDQAGVLIEGMLADETQTSDTVSDIRQILEARRRRQREERARGQLVAQPLGGDTFTQDDAESRRQEVDLARRLRVLQRRDPSLFQLLEVKPLDLLSLRRDLPAGTMVLQLLPTRDTLYLHIMDGESAVIREVQVPLAELNERALRAARAMRLASRNLRGFEPDAPAPTEVLTDADRRAQLDADLAWLYQQLLLPADDWLGSHDRCLIAPPAGPLMYVPMGALIKSPGSSQRYAVQHYNLSVITDLYLLQAGLRAQPSMNRDALVMGDPDGSLPGARGEAATVAGLLGGDLPSKVGADAKTTWLEENCRDAAVIHLATHGKLDSARPEKSHLLFADRNLMVYEAQFLTFRDVDLVVLSCCESGIGARSLEYSTLARAFIGAGAKATIATLWQVDDLHSQDLMQRFYANYTENRDPIRSLTLAKRAMIEAHDPELSPAAWAGYVVFGCPPVQ